MMSPSITQRSAPSKRNLCDSERLLTRGIQPKNPLGTLNTTLRWTGKSLNPHVHYKAGKGKEMVLPTKVLENALNREILLVLKDNRVLEGKLVGYDEYMNLVLEDTEETKEEQVRRLGTVVLRGNNVVTISPK